MSKEQRPQIPTELRRRVLIEAGHRCAIPTCRHIEVDVHHIVPWEKCKKHEYKNLIALCPNCHQRADQGKIDRKSLHIYKGNLRYIYDKFTLFEIDMLYELNKLKNEQILELPSYFTLLLKRIIEIDYVTATERPDKKQQVAKIMGLRVKSFEYTPYDINITKKGRDFVQSLGNEEIGY